MFNSCRKDTCHAARGGNNLTIKYKVSDIAKDLAVTNKKISELLAEHFGTDQKWSHSTVLTEAQLDYLFNYFTIENAVENFDEYFKSGEKAKKATKPAKEEKAKETGKKAEPKKEKTVEKQPVKAVEKEPIKAAEPETSRQTKPEQETKETAKPEAEKITKKQKVAPAVQANQKVAPAKTQETKVAQEKPQVEKQTQPQPQAKKRDGLGRIRDIKDDKEKPAAPKHEVVTRTVDTSAVDINLDKFNEKYNEMAAARPVTDNRRKNANTSNRQKLRKGNKFNSRQPQYNKKKETEAERLQRIQLEKARNTQLKVSIPDEITVGELASRLKVTAAQVIKKLMGLGVMANVTELLDFDTAAIVAEEFNAKVQHEVHVTIEERLFEVDEDPAESMEQRPPVVVVMGHVDHGKTSILDSIRATHVTNLEAGGITQHIGAYQIEKDGKEITFLDTPGHEAFTSMRARGADLTDIAVLVVAADDGIKPQTIESINHAKAAGVTIIVAVNKMDKEGANPDRVKQQLTEHELVPEEWGGDVVVVPVSAKTGQGIDDLLEMINLTADVMDLKANPNRRAKGAVIEARLDKGQGPVATVLIQKGTLKKGDSIIAGTSVGRVRTMRDADGQNLEEAGPSTPVEITGLTDVPSAGDLFDAVEDEKLARELADKRLFAVREEKLGNYTKVTLDNLFDQISAGDMKQLSVIVKADVQGSAEAVKQSLEKLSNEEVRVKVIHSGVGAINKSDVMLANAGNAIIIGFNVRPDPIATADAAQEDVEMRMYRVIYDAINDVEDAMKGMLAPKVREVELGRIEVREVYKVSSVGTIAGCYVLDGKITRTALIRIVRDGIVIGDDEIRSLKRFKDDVKEVAAGYECGITLEKFADIKEGDIYEAYFLEEYRD